MGVPLSIWWRAVAWPWLKKNWYWLLLGPLALLLLKRRPVKVEVVSTQLSEHDKWRSALETKLEAELKEASRAHDVSVEEAKEAREAKVDGLVEAQQERVAEVPEGDTLTDLMKSIGKDVRE